MRNGPEACRYVLGDEIQIFPASYYSGVCGLLTNFGIKVKRNEFQLSRGFLLEKLQMLMKKTFDQDLENQNR